MQKQRVNEAQNKPKAQALSDDQQLKNAIAKAGKILKKKQKRLDKVGQLLMKSADYIEKHGWCRGALQNEAGRVCLLGSIMQAVGSHEIDAYYGGNNYLHSQAIQRLESLPKIEKYGGVADWNDEVCKSGKAAIETLRKAATLPQPKGVRS